MGYRALLFCATIVLAGSTALAAVQPEQVPIIALDKARQIYAEEDALILGATGQLPEYTLLNNISYLKKRRFYTVSIERTLPTDSCRIQMTVSGLTGELVSQSMICND